MEMYKDVDGVIAKYQRLSPEKKFASKMAIDVDFEKMGIKSAVV
jgi:hypothetical protein